MTASNGAASARDRAVASYEALRRHFYQPQTKLYRDSNGETAYAWPFSQVFGATIDLATLPEVGARFNDDLKERLDGLGRYWNSHSHPPAYDSVVRTLFGLAGGGDQYSDDNEWIGLQLIRAAELTGETGALEQAKKVFAFVVAGWDDDPSHAAPGGVLWKRDGRQLDRNTVSNAPGAQLGLQLHLASGDTGALDWSRRIYDWVDRHLRSPEGLYWDHLDPAGNVERTTWSYNQGTMVGAGVLLARATGESSYLDRARQTAQAALAHYGAEDRLEHQGLAFNAIFFKNLALLDEETHDGAYRQPLSDYTEQLWTGKRDPSTCLFQPAPDRGPGVLSQAAAVRLYATLAAAT